MNIFKSLVKKYFVFAFVLTVVLVFIYSSKSSDIKYSFLIYNLFSLIVFTVVLFKYSTLPVVKLTKGRLALLVGSLSIFYVLILDLLYYYYTGDYFELGAVDARFYSDIALKLKSVPIWEWIKTFLYYSPFDNAPLEDFGGAFFVAISYIFYPSPVSYNIFNCLLGTYSAVLIFNIASRFMDKKFSFLAGLSFGLSSFAVYLYSTGMKETVFTFIVLLSFDRYYHFIIVKNFKNLLLLVMSLLAMVFFRPAVMYLIILSIVGAYFLRVIKDPKKLFGVFCLILISIFYIGNPSTTVTDRYYGDQDKLTNSKESEGLAVNSFSYSVATISSMCGPLPTFLPFTSKEQQSLYSFGLTFRVFLSVFFWLGIYSIFKYKSKIIYPIAIFVLLEMASLTLILESFELRLNMPHLPFVYIISFYCLQLYSEKRKKHLFKYDKRIINYSFFVFCILIFYWNLRM